MDQGENKNTQTAQGTQSIAREEPPKSTTPEMELKTAKATKNDAEKILQLLENGNEEAIVLTGKAGTGKTWLAREITKSAVTTKGSSYMSLWISLKEDYQSLHHSIAGQSSISTGADDESKKEESVESLKPKVAEKLDEKIKEMLEKKSEAENMFLLLVLDAEGVVKTKDYDHIMNELFSSEDLKRKLGDSFNIKVLITTRNTEEGIIKECSRVIEIEPLSGDEAVMVLKERVGNDISNHPEFETLRAAIEERSKVLPAQMIMLAGALNHTAKDGSEALERAFGAAVNILQHADKDDPIPLLHFTYEMLPSDCTMDCFWHSWNLLGKHGGVQCNELITHWIIEGHLDLSAGVEKAYEKGHHVMMELIDRGMLKMQDDNVVVLEGAMLGLDDGSCRGLLQTSNLGLASVLEGDNRKVFETMAPADKEGESSTSLLIDGNRLCREAPADTFFQAKQNLKVLALFSPNLTSIPESISKMENLRVLVIRGCYQLNNVDCIKNLKELIVLEISGSPLLKDMPEDLFANMSQLQSCNLSETGIKSLPLSFTNLTELRRLILRKCSFLEALPKLVNLKKIEVIDLSGSSSLIKIQEKSFKSLEKLQFLDFSRTKIEKLPIVQTLKHLTILLVRGCDRLSGLRSMKHLPSLKVLDVSGATRIKEIYYDCFDDTDNLRVLDLSQTEIRFLPDSLGKHLYDLRLKSCSKLEKLPNTTALTELQSLDLSDASSLQKFPDGFFEHLTSLHSLNLSNSKVTNLPSLSNLHKLRHLLLKGCSFESLPELKGLVHLVELDLSDCKSPAKQFPSLADHKYLEIINLSGYTSLSELDASFEHMSWLQVLDLSETQILTLPSLCNPSKLKSLFLKNCTKLQTSPDFKILSQLEHLDLRGTCSLKDIQAESLNHLSDQLQTLKLSKAALEAIQSSVFEKLKKLEVLDLSGEAVESLPSLDSLTNLRQLLLRDCSSLKALPSLKSLSQLEVLDLSGTKVENLGENLTHLKSLHLPEGVVEEFKDGENISAVKDVSVSPDIPVEASPKSGYPSKGITGANEN
ncbi:hypothetical protein PTKIN_Ptkin05aG0006300 [Pterospermum kingtungense]